MLIFLSSPPWMTVARERTPFDSVNPPPVAPTLDRSVFSSSPAPASRIAKKLEMAAGANAVADVSRISAQDPGGCSRSRDRGDYYEPDHAQSQIRGER